MTFAVDFDGTVVTHNYPEVGKNVGAEIVLKNWLKRIIRFVLTQCGVMIN